MKYNIMQIIFAFAKRSPSLSRLGLTDIEVLIPHQVQSIAQYQYISYTLVNEYNESFAYFNSLPWFFVTYPI